MKAALIAGCILGLVIAIAAIVRMFQFVSASYEPGRGSLGSADMLQRVVMMLVGFIIFLVCYKKAFPKSEQ